MYIVTICLQMMKIGSELVNKFVIEIFNSYTKSMWNKKKNYVYQ